VVESVAPRRHESPASIIPIRYNGVVVAMVGAPGGLVWLMYGHAAK
jgi:hypothetical protein